MSPVNPHYFGIILSALNYSVMPWFVFVPVQMIMLSVSLLLLRRALIVKEMINAYAMGFLSIGILMNGLVSYIGQLPMQLNGFFIYAGIGTLLFLSHRVLRTQEKEQGYG